MTENTLSKLPGIASQNSLPLLTNTLSSVFQIKFLEVTGMILCVAAGIFAQASLEPKRGIQANGSYALSDIETISPTGGNLMFNFPLAHLPVGPGGNPGAGVVLIYNSKIYNPEPFVVPNGGGGFITYSYLKPNDNGGWRYNLRYRLEVVDKRIEYRNWAYSYQNPCGQNSNDPLFYNNSKLFKVRMRFPDGGTHEFRPAFQASQNEGYYDVDPEGRSYYCSYSPNQPSPPILITTAPTYTAKTYYSTDGSHLRLEISYSEPTAAGYRQQNWTLFYPDGTRVVGYSTSNEDNATQYTYDRNGNYTVVEPAIYNGQPVTRIADQLGRSINIQKGSVTDYIYARGFGGEEIKWTIQWKELEIDKPYCLNNDSCPNPVSLTNIFRVVDKIILPQQLGSLTYQFDYNWDENNPTAAGWGEVGSITLPTGAKAEYKYRRDDENYVSSSKKVLENYPIEKRLTYLSEYDGMTETRTDVWTYDSDIDTSGGHFNSVTMPDGRQVIEKVLPRNGSAPLAGLIFRTEQNDGRIIEKLWTDTTFVPSGPSAIDPYVKTEFVSITDNAGNLTKTSIKDYNYDQNGNITQIKEYDWVPYSSVPRSSDPYNLNYPTGIPGNAVLKRITINTYYNATPDITSSQTNSNAYWQTDSPRLKNLIKSTEIQDGAGMPVSRSEFYYDDFANRGNLIETKIWDSVKGSYTNPLNTSNSISTTTQFNSYGSPILVTDAKGNQTQLIYGDITTPTGTVNGLYSTQTRTAFGTPIQRNSTAEYDFYTGLVKKATDVDNGVSSETEYDVFGRPKKVKTAAGSPLEAWTQTEYNDQLRRMIIRSDLETRGDGKKIAIQHYDQLGRLRLTRQIENPLLEDPYNETHGIKMQMRYLAGNLDSYQLVSNPYRASTSVAAANEPSMGWTRSKTTSTGKYSEIETFSGAALPAPWGNSTNSSGIVRTDIDADRTLVTDQAGKQRISQSNGLGQLINIWEIVPNMDSATVQINFPNQTGIAYAYQTSYQYDTLNNLKQINQGSQTRSFVYNSLSKLVTADHPEAGQVSYTYDAAGNLKTRRDARGIKTVYDHDALNRITKKCYRIIGTGSLGMTTCANNNETVEPNTPDVTYTYDSLPNAKGKLTKITTGDSQNPFSVTEYTEFDILGKIKKSRQTTDGIFLNEMKYVYSLSGALIEQTYPSGRVVRNILNNHGDLSIVQSKKNQNAGFWNYAKNFSYTAAGAVSSMQLGNGRWESTEFNSRLQPIQFALGEIQNTSDLLKLEFNYGTTQNNGNLLSQTISVPSDGQNPAFMATQTFSYDSLNRLKEAAEIISNNLNWKQVFTYDRFGNRSIDEANSTTIPKNCVENGLPTICINDKKVYNPAISVTDNRFLPDQDGDSQTDYKFNLGGSMERDAQGRTFVYDGENKQVEIIGSDNQTIGRYFYDGNGKRVKKVSSQENTVFLYDIYGKLIAEYSSQTPQLPQVSYLTSDYLGSPRINTDKNGNVIARHDYHPFGSEIQRTNYGDDNVRKEFAGYERDSESDLDFAQARYYTKQLGRFTTVDTGPFTPADPQNFNRYAYVQNNPLKFIDSTGRQIELSGSNAQDFIDYLEANTGLKFKTKTKNGVITIISASKNKNFTGKVNKEFAAVVKSVANASGTAKFDVTTNATNNQGEVVFFDDNETAFKSSTIDKDGNRNIRPSNVNMTSITSVASQDADLAQAFVGHFLVEGLEMREKNANYDLGTEGAHQTGLEAERKILSEALGVQQKDKRYSPPPPNGNLKEGDQTQFVYTSVQYDIVVKSDGSASINKVSPPTVQRPK